MKRNLRKITLRNFTGLFMAVVAVAFTSCSNDDDNLNEETASLTVRMTDAPGDYDEVNVDVQDVMIQMDATDGDEEGWTSLENVETGVYDLLKLTGGVTQLLGIAEVPAGYLGQIRLVLGDDNTVVVNGESQALSTPSAQQSGLKLQVNQELEAGEDYDFLLDFDVDQSVVSAGSSGGFILKPVIRLITQEATSITGSVHPFNFQSKVTATNSSRSLSAYTSTETGDFVLHGVPAGTYKVTITPESGSGFSAKEIPNVEVSAGETVSLGDIDFDEE